MRIKRFILAVAAILCMGMPSDAAPQPEHPEDMTFADNINLPQLPTKAAKPIKTHLATIHQALQNHGMTSELVRDDEVILVTIPCSELFLPNEETLRDSGKRFLRPFLDIMKYPTMYKVVVAVHSDDTGDEEYSDMLTGARAIAIDDFFAEEAHTGGKLNVIPYGLGADEPLYPNNSIANRAYNRRVEIYIVPEWEMIETAKSGRLSH